MAVNVSRHVKPDERDLDELVGWCTSTQDLMAFREALKRMGPERWPTVRARVVESLSGSRTDTGESHSGYAAVRNVRARAAVRLLKLQMLEGHDASRRTGTRRPRDASAADSAPVG